MAIGTAAVVGGVGSVALMWGRNYRRTGNAPDATQRTTRRIVGLLSAAVVSVAVILSEFTGLLGTAGDVVAMNPEGWTQAAIGLLAIAGVSGVVELGVVSMTALVVIVIAVSAAIRN